MSRRLISCIIPFLSVLFDFTCAECYTPNGDDINALNNVTNYYYYSPCNNNNGQVSMCCAIGAGRQGTEDTCEGTGLCYNSGANNWWRESCTDPSWKDPACIKLFLNGTGYGGPSNVIDDPNSVNGVINDVSVTPCSDGSWCYGNNNLACCENHGGFFINADGNQTKTNPSSTTSSTPTPTPTPTSASTSTTPKPSTTASASSSGLSTGAKAGIGVGVAVAVLAVLILAAVLCLRRRKRSSDTGGRHHFDDKTSTSTPYSGPLPQDEPLELQGHDKQEAELETSYRPRRRDSPQELPS